MKNKFFLIIVIILFFIFCFIIFYKGLTNSNIYTPNVSNKKNIPIFIVKDFYLKNNTMTMGTMGE